MAIKLFSSKIFKTKTIPLQSFKTITGPKKMHMVWPKATSEIFSKLTIATWSVKCKVIKNTFRLSQAVTVTAALAVSEEMKSKYNQPRFPVRSKSHKLNSQEDFFSSDNLNMVLRILRRTPLKSLISILLKPKTVQADMTPPSRASRSLMTWCKSLTKSQKSTKGERAREVKIKQEHRLLLVITV